MKTKARDELCAATLMRPLSRFSRVCENIPTHVTMDNVINAMYI